MVDCPVCKNKINEAAAEESYVAPLNGEKYNLYYCKGCDLRFWFPRKTVAEFYENHKEGIYAARHQIGFPEPKFWTRSFFDIFLKNHPDLDLSQKSILDIGCGEGSFLRKIKPPAKEAIGIDMDSASIKNAQKLGVECYNLDPGRASVKINKKFDIITFFEVFEHQDNISKFLEDIKKLGADNFYVVGTVPNTERMGAGYEHSQGADLPPCHFFWFSKKSLENAFIKNGFKNVRVEDYGNVSLGYAASLLETMFIGKFTKNIKEKIKILFAPSLKDYAVDFSVEEINTYNIKKPNKLILRVLKAVKNAPFYIPAIFLTRKFKARSTNLYFEASYSK